jgi:general secretion pathway protein D
MSLRSLRLCLFVSVLTASGLLAQTPLPTPANSGANPSTAGLTAANIPIPGGNEIIGPTKMPDTDLDTVLGALELYTGRSILRPNQLQVSTYNIMLPPMPKSDVVRAIETVLELNNIAVVQVDDKFMKVVPLANARTEAPPMISGSTLDMPPSGRIATKIFMLDFLRAQEFVPQMQVGMTTPGVGQSVVLLQAANAAMVTDTISNLQRIELLLKEVDRPMTSNLQPKFYQLRNGAKASDVVAKIRGFISPSLQTQLGTATTFNADDRTNQIVLIADPRQHSFFDDLIAKLDVKADPNTRNEVIYLKHATAAPVAQLLISIVTGQTNAAQRAGQTGVRPGQINLQPNQTFIAPNVGAINGPGTPTAPQISSAPTNVASSGTMAGNTNEFSSVITIGSDERSNSIIVSGTVDDIRLVKDLIDKLDILLAQVSIQVIIAEVTLSDTDRSGISALNLTVKTDIPNADGTPGGNHGTHISDFAGTVAGWAVTAGVVNPLSFQAAFSDAGNRSNLRVLQAPTITTTHGKEGEVTVGQKIPTISSVTSAPSATTNANSGFQTQESVTMTEVNLDLKVTPLIGDDGSIQLKIDQKVDDVIGNVTVNGNPQPIIGTRHAISFINVYDGQIVVLGGLQRNTLSNDRRKLGFIREIPIISHLLGDRTRKTERTELLLFVRPHVISNEDGTAETKKTIDALSKPNKEQINEFLTNPAKMPKEKLLDQFK